MLSVFGNKYRRFGLINKLFYELNFLFLGVNIKNENLLRHSILLLTS